MLLYCCWPSREFGLIVLCWSSREFGLGHKSDTANVTAKDKSVLNPSLSWISNLKSFDKKNFSNFLYIIRVIVKFSM